MKKEFNLSFWIDSDDVLPKHKVKEFIKKLKEELRDWGTIEKAMEGKSINERIDKLAGKELI